MWMRGGGLFGVGEGPNTGESDKVGWNLPPWEGEESHPHQHIVTQWAAERAWKKTVSSPFHPQRLLALGGGLATLATSGLGISSGSSLSTLSSLASHGSCWVGVCGGRKTKEGASRGLFSQQSLSCSGTGLRDLQVDTIPLLYLPLGPCEEL